MLKEKVAIVTGGTRGIGYVTVKTFLDNGATVVLFGSRKETVDKAIADLKAENKDYKVSGLWPNLSNYREVSEAISIVKEEYGRIDILVNNAGISAKEPIEEFTVEQFAKIMDLNVSAVFNSSKAVVPIMKAAGGGVILNTSSMVSIYGQPAGVGYPTSKSAVNGMTKSLAKELGKDNIRVNAVAPGVIETDMFKALPAELKEAVAKTIPLGRLGSPQDIANAFLYLASDLGSYVTGAILSVDGAAQT